ncbi:MAG: Grx4 family monothiol glutaredoxin [Gammaproteobacteria bacterium]|nr:Grx4 family monothiol glutaredoxin [Gammaproteobacteria bacterium]MDP6616996.1 Grx4 family monothiol glutaredoxin [Gammaproteobacteria bacterium]MDP6695112.1 Grx4 family monothiol glutaredoxin [Gammaproteobacteria bacterium]
MDIKVRIEQQLNEFPVLLYMKGTPDFPQCGFSAQVVGTLKQCRKSFAYVNILEDEELRQGLKEYSDWPTFPQLYIGGELLGGCDIIVEMFESGELQNALDGTEEG